MAPTAGGKITLSSPLSVMPALRARRFSEWVTRDITHMREIGCNMWLLLYIYYRYMHIYVYLWVFSYSYYSANFHIIYTH